MQRLVCSIGLVGALAACSEPPVRPPAAQSHCDASSCTILVPPSGGGVDAGAGDSATGAGIQVEIKELFDTDLSQAAAFLGTVQISALDLQSNQISEEYDTTSSTSKNLEILGGPSVWITVSPLPGTPDRVTYQNIDTTGDPNVRLYLASLSLVEDIAASALLTTDPGSGQVVVYFVDATDAGKQNVTVTEHTAMYVLYGNGGDWSGTGPTDASGQVVLVNVAVPDGGLASLGYTLDGVGSSDAGEIAPVTFPVAAGAVTLLTVVTG